MSMIDGEPTRQGRPQVESLFQQSRRTRTVTAPHRSAEDGAGRCIGLYQRPVELCALLEDDGTNGRRLMVTPVGGEVSVSYLPPEAFSRSMASSQRTRSVAAALTVATS